jgi:hypothetical protein
MYVKRNLRESELTLPTPIRLSHHIGYVCVYTIPVYVSEILHVSALAYETHEMTYAGLWRWCVPH